MHPSADRGGAVFRNSLRMHLIYGQIFIAINGGHVDVSIKASIVIVTFIHPR